MIKSNCMPQELRTKAGEVQVKYSGAINNVIMAIERGFCMGVIKIAIGFVFWLMFAPLELMAGAVTRFIFS